ncbi:putative G-protein coupled receptor 139 [Babylonia areolata]|uniref:putative G-protein coupled receptor 139 n=1 Tax=Babylonia areolata TaxID=304850 RepID=UPI003FD5B5E8
MEFYSNFSTLAPTSSLDALSSLLHEGGGSVREILALFRQLTEAEREYLYDQAQIASEEELLDLLNMLQHDTPQAQLWEFPEQQLRHHLLLYVPPIFIVMGTVGNLLSFVVLRCRAMVKVSSYQYLASLAVADSLVLYIGLLRLWLGEVTGTDFHDSTNWVCKLTISFGYMASDLSVWLIIAVTVERYIVVCFPLRASAMINTARAKKVIGFLVLLMFTINLHFFWTVEIVQRPVDGKNVGNCEAAPHYHKLVDEVWPWVDACIYSFVPFIFIIVLNILIIREVIKARTTRQRLVNTPEHHYHQQIPSRRFTGQAVHSRNGVVNCRRTSGTGEGTKLTIMLLTVSFTFLLTTLPMNIALIFTAFWNQQKTHDLQQAARFNLTKTVTELMMYVNHSINFCLYCATGHKFRQQIMLLMRCKKSNNYTAWSSLQNDDARLPASVHFDKSRSSERILLTYTVPEASTRDRTTAHRTKV